MITITIYLLFTVIISWLNAWTCGSAWVEANALGGWGKLLVWCGAIQSAIGFSIVLMAIEAGLIAIGLPTFGHQLVTHLVQIGYLLLIVPAIGTGLIITVHSWIAAYEKRDFGTISTAAYNSIAQYHNMSGVGSGVDQGMSAIKGIFEEDDGWVVVFVVGALIIAFGGGIAATYALIQHYKGSLGFIDSFKEAP